jgi:hypothetical protein
MGLEGTEAAMKEGVPTPDFDELNRKIYNLNLKSGALSAYALRCMEVAPASKISDLTLYGTEAGLTAFEIQYIEEHPQQVKTDPYFATHTRLQIIEAIRELDNAKVLEKVRTEPIIIDGGLRWVGYEGESKRKDPPRGDLFQADEVVAGKILTAKKDLGEELKRPMHRGEI